MRANASEASDHSTILHPFRIDRASLCFSFLSLKEKLTYTLEDGLMVGIVKRARARMFGGESMACAFIRSGTFLSEWVMFTM